MPELHPFGQDAGSQVQNRRYHGDGESFEMLFYIVKIENLPAGLNNDITETGFKERGLNRLAAEIGQVLSLEFHPFLPQESG